LATILVSALSVTRQRNLLAGIRLRSKTFCPVFDIAPKLQKSNILQQRDPHRALPESI
jgi:hypothetical protein